MEELQNMRTKMEQYRVSKDPALQKTMSVHWSARGLQKYDMGASWHALLMW